MTKRQTLESDLRSRSLWNALRSFRGRRRRMHMCRRRGHRGPGWSGGRSGRRNSPGIEGRRGCSPRVSSRRATDNFQSRRRDRRQRATISRGVKVGGEAAIARTRKSCAGVATRPKSCRRAERFAAMHVRCSKATAARAETSLNKRNDMSHC